MKAARKNDPRLAYLTPLKQTPFHARTLAANRMNNWGPWAGYTTALSFDDDAMEYTAIRNAASNAACCSRAGWAWSGSRARSPTS